METINDILHFLNRLDFAAYLKSDELFSFIKKLLTDEFQNVNSEKLINMLNIVDDLYILFKTQDYYDIQTITSFLRGGIILLVNEKMEDE